jgi:methyl-accepting chemotaxis protein
MLAQRSAAAAKEIKTLIETSVGKVDSGARLVDQAGRTMAEVVTAIKRVSAIVAEITVASQEQSTGVGQVNDAIVQMDDVTQQNAALVEQAAAAAEALQEQAQKLAETVTAFKLETGSRPMAERAPRVERGGVVRLPERSGSARAEGEVGNAQRSSNIARLPTKRAVRHHGVATTVQGGADKAQAASEWAQF